MRNEKGQFVKGHSGNPGGRPKDFITPRLIEKLHKIEDENVDPSVETIDQLLDNLIQRAKEGDHRAFQEIYNRIAGKPTEKIQHAGEDGEPIKIQHVFGRNGNSEMESEVSDDSN